LSHHPELPGCALHKEVDGLEDNMVDDLFFCATITGRRRGHTPFVQGAETFDTGVEVGESDPGCS